MIEKKSKWLPVLVSAASVVSGGVDPRYFGGAKRFQGKVVFSRRPQSCQNGGSVGLVSGLSSVELSRRG
jgi:hypothetical protein